MNYDDDRDDQRGPGSLIAGLVAMGLIGGERGRLALVRLRRLAGWGAVLLLMAAVAGLFLLPRDAGALVFVVGAACALATFLFWCYAAFASWLTRGGDGDEE